MKVNRRHHTSGPPRAIYYALASNIAVATCKYGVALLTNSGAALAEAIHSSADCLNQIIMLYGHRRARARPDEQHPFGFGREQYVYGMLVAMQLFVVGGLASVAVGVFRALHPSPLDRPWLAVGVLCASGVIEAIALRATIRTIEPRHRAHGLFNWFRESGRAAVMLAAGEDFASVVGVAVSLIAVVASMLSQNPLFDALGGIGVGLVLMGTALFSMREIKSLLVGESAHQGVRDEMDAWLRTRPEIRNVVSLVALKWADDLVIAVQAELETEGRASDLVRTIGRIENDLKSQFPAARWIYFEPELREHGRNPL
ncbi:cation diffusion facilitator family transporter [Paraburkholderia sp. XV]|uniref:cation diffusion facilitator family transporter n=1 Tax=Paraburkholderia sp. XV TaxID=2831520 RepID=UPI001CD395C7|nr:cation diffusion facilitator family transporter [Paraburkholderia sp. XV]